MNFEYDIVFLSNDLNYLNNLHKKFSSFFLGCLSQNCCKLVNIE